MYSAYRDSPGGGPQSTGDLQDYYDHVPPPHRMSGGPAYSNIPNNSTTNIPMQMSERGAPGPQGGDEPFFVNHANDASYTSNSAWRDQGTYAGGASSKMKWFIIGGIVAVAAIVGIVVGVVVSKNHHNDNNASTSPSSHSSNSSGPSVTDSDPNDPSKFTKDSNLKQSFYGIAYTPEGSQVPACGNNLKDVITDIQLLSQLTKRIRLYGADCNQTALVLEAIKQTKVDMQVYLGNYVIATDNGAAYQRQRDVLKDAITTYGTDNIAGVTVGNEFMLNYLNDNGGGDIPNSDIGNTGAAILISNIQDTRSMLADMKLNKNIPVGNAEAGSYFNDKVYAAIDYGMSNVHPWFGNVSIDDAAGWTWDFFDHNNVQPGAKANSNIKMFIAETGWPSASKDAGSASDGPSLASTDNLQKFIDTFVCQANQNGTGYFYFEYFDEVWKNDTFGGVEGYWGLFDKDRKLKNIKIPDCAAP